MEQFNSIILFMIVSFCLAAVVILNRKSIPDKLRKPLAIMTLVMVSASFIMLVVRLFNIA